MQDALGVLGLPSSCHEAADLRGEIREERLTIRETLGHVGRERVHEREVSSISQRLLAHQQTLPEGRRK